VTASVGTSSPSRFGPLAGAAIVVVGAVYIVWRFGTLSGTGVLGWLFYAAEIVSFLAVAWTAVMVGRMHRGYVRRAPSPTGTLDVFVTVCGEPVDMVEATLRAALAIDYPHTVYVLNDGKIAGLANWQEIDNLAARLGITCFTRGEGAKGKAANLNYAFARTTGDAIATLDADHLAVSDLAQQVVGYLRDRRVGFVCTAQKFDTGEADVLNNAEPILYRSIQPAKDRDGAAFSCGNGTVYRRAALASIGGFSEWNLVEDLHTSYRLHAKGWESVYHATPISEGTAPGTAAEYARQRLRWATDNLRLFLFDNPLRHPGLRPWQRAHYLHTSGGGLMASVQMVFLLGPALSILFGVQFAADVTMASYLLLATPYLVGSLLFVVAYAGGLAAAQRTVGSVLFNAPIYLIAFVRVVRGPRPDSGATAKVALPRMSTMLLPQAGFVVVLLAAIGWYAADPHATQFMAVIWAGVLLSMIASPMSALTERRRLVEAAQWPIRILIIGTLLGLGFATLFVG
jgi:cellulose synthase (UDP-forming)